MKLKEGAKRILAHIPLKHMILFESNPDFADNTWPLYLELKKRLPSYQMVWIVQSEEGSVSASRSYRDVREKGLDTVIYAHPVSMREKLRKKYFFRRAAAIIFCNRRQRKRDPRQLSLFLCHGSKTKKTEGIYELGDYADFVEVQSHFFDGIIETEYGLSESQLVYHGYPRCDAFYREEPAQLRKKLLKDADGRFLIWLPTFRAQEVGRTDADDGRYAALGIPLFYDRESLMAFDRYLKDRGLYVVYKPHPVQDVRGLVSEKLTNLILITDETLRRADLQLYEVIAASEALITDYSSVFFDYLLLDRPIATTTDDIESWKEGRGFAFDLESMYNKATCRVPDQDALYAFAESVIKGEDPYAEGRREVRDLTNFHQDGKSAERVADFVIEKLTRKQ